MPLTQQKRHNPLMLGYFHRIGLSNKALARRVGVSHSRMNMARTRNVGPDNAEKISAHIARALGLSGEERLELKAEIMGHPDNPVRAYLGNAERAARLLDVSDRTARELVDPRKSVTHGMGTKALRKLRGLGAPEAVVEDVDRRLMPAPLARKGRITSRRGGPEVAAERRATREGLKTGKPRTHEALRDAGLMLKDLYERAGVGKETMRKALYDRCSRRSATAIALALKDAAGLSETQTEAVRAELMAPPRQT